MRIVIDAGHGGADPGAVYNGRREKDDTLELSLAVGEILSDNGIDVVYTRTEDVFDSPIRKAQIANESGADYFVSIHRNSAAFPNQYDGVQTLVYDDSGTAGELAENINRQLENVGYRNINVEERKDLAVLRRTQMPAVLVEAGFINSDTDNRLFDTKAYETARAIADGILETVGTSGDSNNLNSGTIQNNKSQSGRYGVQTGLFSSKNNADMLKARLNALGINADVSRRGNYYAVVAGRYDTLEEARALETELRLLGYDTLIVTS